MRTPTITPKSGHSLSQEDGSRPLFLFVYIMGVLDSALKNLSTFC
ncbi:MAG: hypothetical protein ACI9SC_001004 [Gammaproteobacteria bacterium]